MESKLSKLFKPVTETQKATAKEITEAQKATAEKFTSELLPIKEGISCLTTTIKQLPITPIETEKEAITLPAYSNAEISEKEILNLGPIAKQFLFAPYDKKKIDTNFGFYVNEDGKFKIGDKFVTFEGDDIIVDGRKYEGTIGFWYLIINKNPNPEDYTFEDLEKYKDLLIKTNAIYQESDPNQKKAKGNYQGPKWNNIVKNIWEEINPKAGGKGGKGRRKRQEDPTPSTSGTGLTILPNDTNALIERFDLLLASQNAGHTGVRNELVSIFDELKRQGVINTNVYKKLNSIIKK